MKVSILNFQLLAHVHTHTHTNSHTESQSHTHTPHYSHTLHHTYISIIPIKHIPHHPSSHTHPSYTPPSHTHLPHQSHSPSHSHITHSHTSLISHILHHTHTRPHLYTPLTLASFLPLRGVLLPLSMDFYVPCCRPHHSAVLPLYFSGSNIRHVLQILARMYLLCGSLL